MTKHKIIWTILFLLLASVSANAQNGLGVKTEFLCELKANLVLPPQMVGQGPHGTRLIFNVSGGTVKGPKLNGKLLPGADWVLIRPDGAAQLDVRGTIRTDDGQLVNIYYRGISLIPSELSRRIASGKKVNSSDYYYRITPVFETGAQKYRWLNKVISVGVGTLGKDFVSYRIYVIK
jgi:hypothetical protein